MMWPPAQAHTREKAMEGVKLSAKNYLGYATIDLGNNIAFAVVSSYLTLFYTDVLGAHFDSATGAIWLAAISAIMIVARVWDGINDPIMGYLVQRAKPTAAGKFRGYILYGGIPLAILTVLMFLPLENLSLGGAIAFATVTYIAYGMLYTVVLVPYGSLATVMTRDSVERSRLSIARSIGGGIGGVPAGILFPIIVYSTTAAGVKVLDGTKLVIAMAVISCLVIAAYVVGFFTTKENYEYPASVQKMNLRVTLKGLLKNKPFIIMSLAGMLLIASSMYISTVDLYLFNIYYGKTGMMTFVTICTYAPMVVLIPFTGKIIKRFGKKAPCLLGLAIATAASLVTMCWHIPNPWVFLLFTFLQGCGIGFFTLEVWALAMDVIDYQELLTKRREEATSYAIFTFMRKIGQAIAAIVPALLAAVGYVSAKGYDGQTVETVDGIYTIATVVPFVLFALMLVLFVIYPLNRKKDEEMRAELAELRASGEVYGEAESPKFAPESAGDEVLFGAPGIAPDCEAESAQDEPENGGGIIDENNG